MGERNVFAQAGNCWAHELGTRLLRKQAEAGRQQGCGPEGGEGRGLWAGMQATFALWAGVPELQLSLRSSISSSARLGLVLPQFPQT